MEAGRVWLQVQWAPAAEVNHCKCSHPVKLQTGNIFTLTDEEGSRCGMMYSKSNNILVQYAYCQFLWHSEESFCQATYSFQWGWLILAALGSANHSEVMERAIWAIKKRRARLKPLQSAPHAGPLALSVSFSTSLTNSHFSRSLTRQCSLYPSEMYCASLALQTDIEQ